jgi:Flp pilus assembly protein TadG
MFRFKKRRRRGATTLEFAIACPIAFFLLFATIVGAMGVFRYQQVATLAREGARWACVHGGEYAQETNQPAATPADVFEQAMLPITVALDLERLSYEVTWDESNMPLSVHEDYETPIGNTVTVTVSYEWFPEMYLVGPLTLTSTSTAQMMY